MPCWSKRNISYVCFYSIYLWGNIFLAIIDKFGGLMGNWNKLTSPWNMRMCIFQFPIDPKISHKWLEKCQTKDKFDKSTLRISSIYCSKAAFIDNMKFTLSNQNINNLMLINFHISLITKRFFRSFDHHRDKTCSKFQRIVVKHQ